MASTLSAQDSTVSPQQLRTFHLTGSGLETLAPPAPFLTEAAAAVPPPEDVALPVGPDALAHLHAAALTEMRKPARLNFSRLLSTYRDKLRSLLEVEHHHSEEALSAQTLSSELGKDAGQFFDTEALSKALRRPAAGVKPMARDRHARIEHALGILTDYLHEDQRTPDVIQTSAVEAVAICQEQLDRLSSALQALQVARLEAEAAYDATVHDEQIARIDWQAADTSELHALPPVMVVEPIDQIQHSLTQLGRLLSSPYPVQILVSVPGWTDAPDLGAIAMAYREAYVLSSSVGSSRHLMDGLREMAASLCPAIALVATPEAFDEPTARKQCALLLAARLSPLYRYNPSRGDTIAARFQWEPLSTESITPVDAAAFFSSMTPQFRVLPEAEANEHHLPFVQTRERRRVVFTQSLLNQCDQRRRTWRLWEELAGIDSSIVEAAVDRAKKEVQQAADARLEAALQQARSEGARNAVTRLVSVLTNPQASVAAPAAAAAPLSATPAGTTQQAAVTAAEPTAAPAAPQQAATAELVDPYIDSYLCTSCNDCMKINARLFLYNADKQAYLGDPSLGTFAELVKAAEGCPGKCIHPCTPRPGDTTATPALIAKAAKLG